MSPQTNMTLVFDWASAPRPWNKLGPRIAKIVKASAGGAPGEAMPPPRFPCKMCGTTFLANSGLALHLKYQHNHKPDYTAR